MEKVIERKIREFSDDMVKNDLGVLILVEKGDTDISFAENITKGSIIGFIMDQIIEDSDIKDEIRGIIYKLDLVDTLAEIKTLATESENLD